MADINACFEKVFEAEYNNDPKKFLHLNAGEKGYTLGGIYQKANPNSIDWQFVNNIVQVCKGDLQRASNMLFYDERIFNQVIKVYTNNYFLPLKLDKVHSQIKANEMFLFGVVAGVKTSVKLTQKLVGVVEDGIIGPITINAINECKEDYFDTKFDELEKAYFIQLAEDKPFYRKFLKGWLNRSEAV